METIKIIDLLNMIANENEYWQQLDDYGTYNTYFISTQGRICNQKGKILKQQIDKSGYPRIMLKVKDNVDLKELEKYGFKIHKDLIYKQT